MNNTVYCTRVCACVCVCVYSYTYCPTRLSVYKSVATRFIDATLELGGKDPAYVAPDADLEAAAAGLVDGGMFNAGQSCCGIERTCL